MIEKNHHKAIKLWFLIAFLVLSIGCVKSQQVMDKSVVENFELKRYLGTWYEIARFDHRFERNLVGVTATYSLREDGEIKVVNNGYKNDFDGFFKTAIGKAKITNLNCSAHLKVSFFWFFYSDYYIMELDKNYQWVVIGSSSDKYLWILSRTPQIEEPLNLEIIRKIEARGYDTGKLIWVKQR